MYAGTALGYMAEATAGQGESSLTGVRETKEIVHKRELRPFAVPPGTYPSAKRQRAT